MSERCFTDNDGKKWVVDGYYLDGNETWTILKSVDSQEVKRVKGML